MFLGFCHLRLTVFQGVLRLAKLLSAKLEAVFRVAERGGRVAIARSLVNDPVVILADEATGNLDTRTSFEIMALLQDLNQKGKTIVFVTHEADIAKFMTRQVVFRDGHIIREEVVTNRNNAVELLKGLPLEELV